MFSIINITIGLKGHCNMNIRLDIDEERISGQRGMSQGKFYSIECSLT